MDKLKSFFNTHGKTLLFFIIGLVLWGVSSLVFEKSQSSIGPEFITRLPIKIVYLAAAWFLTRVSIKSVFPTVFIFTTTNGDQKISGFRAAWDKDGPLDNRVPVAAFVYTVVFLVISQILMSAS